MFLVLPRLDIQRCEDHYYHNKIIRALPIANITSRSEVYGKR